MVSNTPIECILDREHPSYLNLSVTERRPQVIIMGLTTGVATDNMQQLGLMHIAQWFGQFKPYIIRCVFFTTRPAANTIIRCCWVLPYYCLILKGKPLCVWGKGLKLSRWPYLGCILDWISIVYWKLHINICFLLSVWDGALHQKILHSQLHPRLNDIHAIYPYTNAPTPYRNRKHIPKVRFMSTWFMVGNLLVIRWPTI